MDRISCYLNEKAHLIEFFDFSGNFIIDHDQIDGCSKHDYSD